MDIDFNKILDELRGLDQDNIGSWPLWTYVASAILVFVLIVGIGTWYMVLPKVDELAQAQKKEQELRSEFERKQKKVANLAAYKEQLDKMKKQFSKLLRQLPSESEVPQLIKDITHVRMVTGLKEELFRPKGSVKKDFYVILPYNLRVTGKYHELATFVSKVAALPRIVTLDNFTLTPINSEGELRMTVTARTYRYLNSDRS